MRRATDAFNSGELFDDSIFDPEIEFRPFTTTLIEGGTYRGFDGLRDYQQMREETWESLEVELSETRERGDAIVAQGRLHARGRASGVQVDVPVLWLCRV